MAIFRKIHTSFWSDSFIAELDNDHKLFYLYLMTNERTRQCGVYEITKRQICFDLGYSMDKVCKLLKFFIIKGKIKYNDKTNEIGIGNWLKYNKSTSPKVQSCVNKEFLLVKDTILIEYVKSMDTETQEEQEEEQEQEEDVLPTKPKKVIKISFEESDLFDKDNFVKHFPTWQREKLRHYYDAALRYSIEGNKYVSWELAIQNWERKDAAKGITYAPIVEEMTQAEINKQKEREFYARL